MSRLVLLAALLTACGCGGSATQPTSTPTGVALGPTAVVARLQEGGLVVYLRHAATDQSQDDEDTSNLSNCSTQRNLNDEGRAQARTLGRAFRKLRIPVGDVLASEYCRTRQTALLAFGRATAEPGLTGFPNEGEPGYEERLRLTRRLLATVPVGAGNTILVAHVKNLEASAALSVDEGELAVFEPSGRTRFRLLGRIPAEAWPQLLEELSGS